MYLCGWQNSFYGLNNESSGFCEQTPQQFCFDLFKYGTFNSYKIPKEGFIPCLPFLFFFNWFDLTNATWVCWVFDVWSSTDGDSGNSSEHPLELETENLPHCIWHTTYIVLLKKRSTPRAYAYTHSTFFAFPRFYQDTGSVFFFWSPSSFMVRSLSLPSLSLSLILP